MNKLERIARLCGRKQPDTTTVLIQPSITLPDLQTKRTDSDVWLAAYVAVAASSNCSDPSAPAKWADRCLTEYRTRFKR